jgi:hypothetical protein
MIFKDKDRRSREEQRHVIVGIIHEGTHATCRIVDGDFATLKDSLGRVRNPVKIKLKRLASRAYEFVQ